MAKNKVLFISQEIAPYLPDTPFSLQGKDIPQGIIAEGYEARTFLPKYGCINERRNQLHEVIRLSGLNIVIDDTDHPLIIKVATLQPSRMQVYFIDNDDYFDQQAATGLETDTDPEANDERMIFYAHGVIETVKKLRWDPQVIQCMGWISSLVPLYLRQKYHDDPAFAHTNLIYSLRSDSLAGPLDPRFAEKLRMAGFTDEQMPWLASGAPADYAALTKTAIDNSDAIAVTDADVDPALIEYARSTGKPLMLFPGNDSLVKELAEFYHTLGA